MPGSASPTRSMAPVPAPSCSSTACCSPSACTSRSRARSRARGNRVVTIDLLGHGRSDRPTEPARYSTPLFAAQVVALLDHLGVDEAVILGTSLGANTALEVCHARARARARHGHRDAGPRPGADRLPRRVRSAHGRARRRRGRSRSSRRSPRARSRAAGCRSTPTSRSTPCARIPGPAAPSCRACSSAAPRPPPDERRAMLAPTLVIGHRRDPIHPLTDAGMLADELPNGAPAARPTRSSSCA